MKTVVSDQALQVGEVTGRSEMDNDPPGLCQELSAFA